MEWIFGDASATQGAPSPVMPVANGQAPVATVGQGPGPAQGAQGGASAGIGSLGDYQVKLTGATAAN